MATDFVGTNSEKVDKLIGSHLEQRTFVRVASAAILLLLPVTIGLVSSLVVNSFEVTARADVMDQRMNRVEGRLDAIETKLADVDSRLTTVETVLVSMDRRLVRVESRLDALEAQNKSMAISLAKLESQQELMLSMLKRMEEKVGTKPKQPEENIDAK